MLNNEKDDLGIFDPWSDKGFFIGYSSNRKVYRIFNKRTQCVEESVHMIFDESGELNEVQVQNNAELEKNFKLKEIQSVRKGWK